MTTSQHDLSLSRENLARFSSRLYEAVRNEVPAYAAIVDAEMDLDFRQVIQENLRLFFRCLAEDRQPGAGELAVLARSARRRLRQAVPLEAIFHSYRVGVRAMWECVLEVAPQRDHGRLAVRALEYADRVSTAAAQAYLEERQHLAQSRQEASRLLLTRMLREEVDESAATGEASSLGLDFSRPHAVLVAAATHDELRPTTSADLMLAAVQSRLLLEAPGALAVLLSSGLVIAAPASGLEAVEELVAAALAEAGAAPTFSVGVGTVGSGVRGLAGSHREAVRARTLGGILHPIRVLHRYEELALFDLFKEGQTMDAFVREGLGPLLALKTENRSRMADTLSALFSNALNRKRAAFQLGVHQNTLSHRIRALERLLGGSFTSGEFCFRIELALRLLPLTSFRQPAQPVIARVAG